MKDKRVIYWANYLGGNPWNYEPSCLTWFCTFAHTCTPFFIIIELLSIFLMIFVIIHAFTHVFSVLIRLCAFLGHLWIMWVVAAILHTFLRICAWYFIAYDSNYIFLSCVDMFAHVFTCFHEFYHSFCLFKHIITCYYYTLLHFCMFPHTFSWFTHDWACLYTFSSCLACLHIFLRITVY